MSGAPPKFTRNEVFDHLRDAAKDGLTQTRNAEGDLIKWGWDLEDAEKAIAACSIDEIDKHELSENYPRHNDYVVVLKMRLEGERERFYVKVALALPKLKSGELMSFHPLGHIR